MKFLEFGLWIVFVPVIFCVGTCPAAEFPSCFGSAAKPDQNQADARDPTGQKRPQHTAGRHGEGRFVTSHQHIY